MYERVSDPELLKRLDSNDENSQYEKVTDPELIKRLNSEGTKSKSGVNLFNKDILSQLNKSHSDRVPSLKELPTGISEGFKGSLAALPGIGNQLPSHFGQQTPIPENVEGASTARHIGRAAGATPVFGSIASPASALLKYAGIPAMASMMGGAGIAGGLITPGNIINRLMGAGEAAAIPLIPGALKYGYQAISSPVKKAIGSLKNLQPYEQAAKNASVRSEADIKALNEAKALSESETGMSNPNRMQNIRNERQEQLSNMEKPEVGNYPIQSRQQSELNLENANKSYESAKMNTSDAEKDVQRYLNKGLQHDVRAARDVKKVLEDNKRSISSEYNNVEKDLSDKGVLFDNAGKIRRLNNDMLKLNKSGLFDDKEMQSVKKELLDFTEKEVIPANDFLKFLRSAKQRSYKARQNAYKPGMDAEERSQWKAIYEDFDKRIQQMETAFEEAIGPQASSVLKNLNKRWRTEVVPLQNSTTYQNILYNSKMPKDIMYSLRGDNPADVIMRNAIKDNPEILKNVVGQKYADKPDLLHKAGELTSEYLERMPELQQLLKKHASYLEELPKQKQTLELNKKSHEDIINKEKKAFGYVDKQQEKLNKYEMKKESIEKEIKLLDKNIEELKKQSKSKDISLKRKINIERKLKELKEKRVSDQKWLATGAGLVGAGVVGYKASKWLGKSLDLGNKESP